jgi:hypothetical protein
MFPISTVCLPALRGKICSKLSFPPTVRYAGPFLNCGSEPRPRSNLVNCKNCKYLYINLILVENNADAKYW